MSIHEGFIRQQFVLILLNQLWTVGLTIHQAEYSCKDIKTNFTDNRYKLFVGNRSLSGNYNDLKLFVFFKDDLVILKNSSFLCNAKNETVIGIIFRFLERNLQLVKKYILLLRPQSMGKLLRWSVHLRVRIQDFHSCHRGSNPLQTTILRTKKFL